MLSLDIIKRDSFAVFYLGKVQWGPKLILTRVKNSNWTSSKLTLFNADLPLPVSACVFLLFTLVCSIKVSNRKIFINGMCERGLKPSDRSSSPHNVLLETRFVLRHMAEKTLQLKNAIIFTSQLCTNSVSWYVLQSFTGWCSLRVVSWISFGVPFTDPVLSERPGRTTKSPRSGQSPPGPSAWNRRDVARDWTTSTGSSWWRPSRHATRFSPRPSTSRRTSWPKPESCKASTVYFWIKFGDK